MKNKQNKKNKHTAVKIKAFNPNFILWLIGFIVTLYGNVYLYCSINKVSWILALFLLIFAGYLFIDAVYYIFTKDEMYFVTFWGYKMRLPWFYVTSITKYDFWSSFCFRHLMGYEIYYDQPYKGKLIRKILILALTP